MTNYFRQTNMLESALPAALLLGILLLLSGGCAHKDMMTPAQAYLMPDESHAVISFVTGKQGDNIAIWHKESILGILIPNSILQYRLPPGKHLFLATLDKHSSFLASEVEAGRHYVVLVVPSPFLGLDTFPLVGDKAAKKLPDWFTKYQLLEPIALEQKNYEEKHKDNIRSLIAKKESGKNMLLRKINPEHYTNFLPTALPKEGAPTL